MNQAVESPVISTPETPREDDSRQFLNRDLSWLEFNKRVLHEALDERTPLLERVRFLGIFTSNLDEFFMKRGASLHHQAAKGIVSPAIDGKTAAEIFAAIRQSVRPMLKQQAECYTNEIRPLLAQNGIALLEWKDLTAAERESADKYFQANVFPILTPLAVDPGSPFPFMSNLSLSLGVVLHHPDRGENLFARVKVPEVLLTCDPDITRDVVELFHYLTGRSLKRNYRRLLVAPVNMRERLWQVLQIMLNDRRQAWVMDSEGGYRQLRPNGGEDEMGTQQALMNLARQEAIVSPEELNLLR